MKARFKQYGPRRFVQGFTLVELLVVMAIVSLLAGLSIAGVASFTNFASSALQRSTRDVFNLLKSARIYASTHSVDTAVVYSMNRVSTGPLIDSIEGVAVREIVAAAIMYRYPVGIASEYSGKFVGIPGEYGEFQLLEEGTGIALWDIAGDNGGLDYYTTNEDYINLAQCNNLRGITSLGMSPVVTRVVRPQPPYLNPDDPNFYIDATFPAHVFQSSGRIETASAVFCEPVIRERYRLYVAPSPDEPVSVRLIDTDGTLAPGNNIYRTISLYRSTGRVVIEE